MAYRFNGSSDYVRFAIGPLGGVTLSAFTAALFLKRGSTSPSDQYVLSMTDSALSAARAAYDVKVTDAFWYSNSSGNVTQSGYTLTTTPWYLLAVSWSGSGAARFHLHDGTSWTHSNATAGSIANTALGGTDRIYMGGPTGWGVTFNGDVVCAGIKKADSTDLQVETLTRTAFSSWTGFGFDWLVGFDSSLVSGGLLQDQSSAGTGDEVTRSGTTQVSDPAGWTWAAAPVAPKSGFLALM